MKNKTPQIYVNSNELQGKIFFKMDRMKTTNGFVKMDRWHFKMDKRDV